jgi:TP901-1 family phage major tail protein
MPAQRGRDLLLRLDAAGTDVFATVAGLRTQTLTFNADTVDATSQESPGQWRELLADAAPKTATLRGAGIFRDTAADASIRTLFFEGRIRPWQVVIPDFGTLTGPFQITSLAYAGAHDGEISFEIALASAGPLAFQAL